MKRYLFNAVIFDLDGVLTQTARVHANAWKKVFDKYLKNVEKQGGAPFREFTVDGDYALYVDGKPRDMGIKNFLESRGIEIPLGNPSDSAGRNTIYSIGNEKNEMFRKVLKEDGVEVYSSTIELVKELRKAGIRVGIASSSKNCRFILQCAGIENLFETRVDGEVSAKLGLKGKPEGDIFVKAARNLNADPSSSVVVEDAISGVQAGRNGGFGLVLGMARKDNEKELIENGADIVIKDSADMCIECMDEWFRRKPKPLFEFWDGGGTDFSIACELTGCGQSVIFNPHYNRGGSEALLNGKKLIFFLDYDGTLTPIVDRPELARMTEGMRSVIRDLSKKCSIAVVSGRLKDDVRRFVGIENIFYAGSHGFDIEGPGISMVLPEVNDAIPMVSELIEKFKKDLNGMDGLLIEEKKFSVAVHYRLVGEKHLPRIRKTVEKAVKRYKGRFRIMSGKKVFEVLPNIEWNKGMAIKWIMESMNIPWTDASVVYIGDDVTDEYAFRSVRTRGTGILVCDHLRESAADFQVNSVEEVKRLFEKIINGLQ